MTSTPNEHPPHAKTLYGVIHVPPLPGTPFHRSGAFPDIVRSVLEQSRQLAEGEMDGALLQTADRVYSVEDESDPARIAAMTLLASRVIDEVPAGFAVGIQIMRHAVSPSLAVAKLTGAAFVRVDALVGATLSTHGWVNPDPLRIMTYRRVIEAMDIAVIADIDSMHYRWPDSYQSTGSVAARTMTVGADAVCLAHPDTDEALRKIEDVRQKAPSARIFLGGHVNNTNAIELLALADGAFVNRCLTHADQPDRMDIGRIRQFVAATRASL